MSTEETEAAEVSGEPAPPTPASRSARHERPRRARRSSRRRPGPLFVFALAFVLLLAAAVCVLVGNIKPNSTLLPVISFYLSGAAVVLTIVALFMPGEGHRREGSSQR